MADLDDDVNAPLFRATKRRKVFRKRQEDEESESIAPVHSTSPHSQIASSNQALGGLGSQAPEAEELHDGELSVAEILRRRKMGKPRRAGIEFSRINQSHRNISGTEQSLENITTPNEDRSVVDVAANRFAPQTGLVAEVTNKHMMAYIDSRMAELREGANAPDTPIPSTALDGSASTAADTLGRRQPAGLGKLQEIDLGLDAKLRNIERTEAATRRLENGAVEGDESRTGGRIRLGRDGKPWRGRKRRDSEDIKRDNLVEEVLKETRLDIYDEPDAPTDANDDQAADDRIAEQFRREFLDAIQNKHIRRKAPAPPGPARAVKGEDRPKGPKLGGSRSARAAMHAKERAAKKR